MTCPRDLPNQLTLDAILPLLARDTSITPAWVRAIHEMTANLRSLLPLSLTLTLDNSIAETH